MPSYSNPIHINNSGSTQTGPSGSWGVGNDSTGDGSVATPWATLSKGISEAQADGTIDAIILWDGTYKDGNYTLASLTDVDIVPENVTDGTNLIIQNNNVGDDRVFAANTVTNNVLFGRLTIDAEGKDHCFRSSGSGIAGPALIYDGTLLLNWGETAHQSQGNTTFRGRYKVASDLASAVASPASIRFTPQVNDRTLLMGALGSIDQTGSGTGTASAVDVNPVAATTGTNVRIEDGLSIEIKNTGATSQGIKGIGIGAGAVSAGYGEIYIGKVVVGMTGSLEPIGIILNIDKSASNLPVDYLEVNMPCVTNRSYDSLGAPTGGYGVNIGGEFDQAGGDTIGEVNITELRYRGCEVHGFNHGEYFGGLDSLDLGYGSLITKSVLSAIIEGCNNVQLHSRFIRSPDDGAGSDCLRIKECTNSSVEHNTVVVTSVDFLGSGYAENDATTSSTGNSVLNNNIIFPAGLTGSPEFVDSGSSVTAQSTYENNHYWKGGDSFASGDFNDQGVGRDLSGWRTNVEATALSDSNNQTNLVTGEIGETSALVDAGSTNATSVEDKNGRFFSFRRPVGAFTQHSSAIAGSSGQGFGIMQPIMASGY